MPMQATIAPRLPVTAPRAAPHADVRVALWPILVVLYATLLPREVRFSLGTLTFYADRIGLVLILPYVVRKLLDGAIKFVLPDFLVLFSGVWMIVAMSAVYGFGDGLVRGGSLALDSSVGYFLARISFRSLRDIRYVLILFAPGLLFVGGLMAVESITHRPLAIPFAQRIFGPLPKFLGGEATNVASDPTGQVRLGLMRAQGPFSHSILAGLYMASLLPLYLRSGIRGWPKWAGVIACLCSFFSVSSAAILGLSLIFILVVFDIFSRQFRDFGWRQFLWSIGLVVVALQLFTSNGVSGIATRLTLDSSTAFFRQIIWQYATISVRGHPLFGIGFEGYARPVWVLTESIDAHWLLLAVRFGLPETVAMFVATVATLIAVGRASVGVPPVDRRFYRGIAIGLGVMSVMMFTVTLWGGALSLFTLLLGGSVACAQRSFAAPARAG